MTSSTTSLPLLPHCRLLVGLLLAPLANADLITNAGFEDGLNGWTVVNAGLGDFQRYSGGAAPISGFIIPAPVGGGFAMVTDQTGPGAHVLYQDFIVPTDVTSALLTFDYFVASRASSFINNGTLAHASGANQHVRVDLMAVTANAFSTAAGDVDQNVFQTLPGDPLVMSNFVTLSLDVSSLFQAHLGETLRLRFGQVDNQGNFQFGVDNVRLMVTRVPQVVPDTASTGALTGGLAFIGLLLVHRRVKFNGNV
jgi:hypothetical protein